MKYNQVRDQLEKLLASGEYAPGDKLPSERELANTLSVSLVTLRKSLSDIEQKGLISREHGRGTFMRGVSHHFSPPGTSSIAYVMCEHRQMGDLGYEEALVGQQHMLRSVASHFSHRNRQVMLVPFSDIEFAEGRMPPILERKEVAGVVLDGEYTDMHCGSLLRLGIPVVALGNRPIHMKISRISVDINEASYLLTKGLSSHLAGKGKIHLVTEPFQFFYSRQILAGYARACREVGQDVELHVLSQTGNDIGELRRYIERLDRPFGMLFHPTMASMAYALDDIYNQLGIDYAENPVSVYTDPVHVPANLRAKLNIVNFLSREEHVAIASEILEELIAGKPSRSVVMVPQISSVNIDGALRINMESVASTHAEL